MNRTTMNHRMTTTERYSHVRNSSALERAVDGADSTAPRRMNSMRVVDLRQRAKHYWLKHPLKATRQKMPLLMSCWSKSSVYYDNTMVQRRWRIESDTDLINVVLREENALRRGKTHRGFYPCVPVAASRLHSYWLIGNV